MWVIYQKADKKIVGLTANCVIDIDKETALKCIVEGLVSPGNMEDYDAIQVQDRIKARKYMTAYPDSLVIKGTKDKPQLAIESPKRYSLILKSDAPDVHPVDGIPEIPADGTSFTTITVQKMDEKGKPQRGPNDNNQLYLRTDHGILQNADGTEDINSIKLTKGEAAFRLLSEKFKRVARVQVMSADPNLENTVVRIEFI